MRLTPIASTTALLVTAMLAACTAPQADDPGSTPGEPRRVLLDNEFVEVFTLTVNPGSSLPAHTGQARVVYSLGDYRVRYTEGGQSREADWRSGDVHSHRAGDHGLDNVGTSPARLLIVARKNGPLTTTDTPRPEAAGASTPYTHLVLDDAQFLVTEVHLPAGAAIPAHQGLDRVVFALSDSTLRYEADGAPARETTHTSGEAHWHAADRHAVTNTGETEARYLLFQLRR
jgi:hypothetical protein